MVRKSDIFNKPLGRDLLAALDAQRDEEIAERVGNILEKVWVRELNKNQIEDLAVELQTRAHFQHVVSLGDVAIASDLASIETRRRYSQALIELGALHAAELELNLVLRDLEKEENGKKELGEAHGLIGRLSKQRYIDGKGKRGSDLRAAMKAYLTGYEVGTDKKWHGVNLVALMKRADKDNVALPKGSPDPIELADEVLAEAQEEDESLRGIWDRTTELEALLAMGKEDEARKVAEKLAETEKVNNFELRSLRRQLIEVWELDESDALILAINDRSLTVGSGGEIPLPDSAMKLEKILGTAMPLGYENLMRGLQSAESVCKMTDSSGQGWGTGFLLKGALIHESLGGEYIIVTNAHVVSALDGEAQLVAEEVEARFDVTKGPDGQPLVIRGFEEIWSSPASRRDVTLLRFKADLPEFKSPIELAPALPPRKEGAFVYVIGHPWGADVKFSIRGNDLLGYDNDEIKVHYTAPTEGGSSGSPVFNGAWQLMALHHAGSKQMKKLDESGEIYKANEGITIESIKAAYKEHLEGAG